MHTISLLTFHLVYLKANINPLKRERPVNESADYIIIPFKSVEIKT